MAAKVKVGVLGASGYTGAELVRLLIRHPQVEIALLTADRRAGQAMRQVFPQFSPFDLPKLVSIEDVDWISAGLDLAFCALPHSTTLKVVPQVPGVLQGGGSLRRGHLHAPPLADESRDSVDDLCAQPQQLARGASCDTLEVLREGAVRARAAVRGDAADPARARLQHDRDRRRQG